MKFVDFLKKKTLAKSSQPTTHDAEMVAQAKKAPTTPDSLASTQAYIPFRGDPEVPRKSLDQVQSKLRPSDRLNYYNNGNYFITVNEPEEEQPPTPQDYQAVFGKGFKNWINDTGSVA